MNSRFATNPSESTKFARETKYGIWHLLIVFECVRGLPVNLVKISKKIHYFLWNNLSVFLYFLHQEKEYHWQAGSDARTTVVLALVVANDLTCPMKLDQSVNCCHMAAKWTMSPVQWTVPMWICVVPCGYDPDISFRWRTWHLSSWSWIWWW